MYLRRLAIISTSLVLAAGCKDKTKDAGAPGATPGVPGVPGVPGAPAAAAPASDLALLAGDSEVVFGVDWQQLQASGIWKQLILPQLMKEKDVVMVVSEIKNRCGIDLTTEPKTLTLGIKGIGNELPDGGVVVTGLDKAKVLACPGKFKAEAEKEHTVIKTEGDSVLALDSDGYGMSVTVVGPRTFFMIGHAMSMDRIKKAIAGTDSLASSQAFLGMHGKIDTKQTGWGFFRGPTMEKEVAEILGTPPKAVYGAVSMKDGVTAQLRARMETPEAATKTVDGLKDTVKGAGEAVDKADIAADGQDIKLDVAVAGAKLDTLIKQM